MNNFWDKCRNEHPYLTTLFIVLLIGSAAFAANYRTIIPVEKPKTVQSK